MTDGRTDGQTDGLMYKTDIIRHSPTNVEHPIDMKKVGPLMDSEIYKYNNNQEQNSQTIF